MTLQMLPDEIDTFIRWYALCSGNAGQPAGSCDILGRPLAEQSPRARRVRSCSLGRRPSTLKRACMQGRPWST